MVLEPKDFEFCGEPAPYKWGTMWLCAAHWDFFKDMDDTSDEGLMHSIIIPSHMRGLM